MAQRPAGGQALLELPILLNTSNNDLGNRTECNPSKTADNAKLAEVVDTSDGCLAIQRDLKSLDKWAIRIS